MTINFHLFFHHHYLVGGFRHFLFSSLPEEMIPNLTSIFFKWVDSTTNQLSIPFWCQGKAVDGTHHCGHHQRWRHTNANALGGAGAGRRSASFGGAAGGAGRAGRGTRRRAVAGGEPGGRAESDGMNGQENVCVLDCCHFGSDLGCQRSSFIMMMDFRGCFVVQYK